ncbi:TM0106 family RecB-like putative nuclease [Prochlorococcus marinus]|uniref:TM0106 family RecB-like putative nuclease n=1 Tax=Prochlorococcus marinus TaxID=1219 RepID=UPI0022B35C7C|nr:TM0106 family RecB-like putative nuclease [Prochlorococcus marinus]
MLNPILERNLITDRLFFSWIRCKRKAWLDLYEQNHHKVWTAHRALQLDHQYKSIQQFLNTTPGKGVKACQRGDIGVIGLRLRRVGPTDIYLEGHPTMLYRIEGSSCWGNYSYIPIIVRQGHRLTRENRLAIALWAYLLEEFQQGQVNHGIAVSKKRKNLEIQDILISKNLRSELFESLIKAKKDLTQIAIPPLTNERKKCTLCSWRELCNKTASKEGDLSEVSGIGAKRKNILQEIGIQSVNDLASTDPYFLTRKLNKYGDQHESIAHQLILQAKSQIDLNPTRITLNPLLNEIRNTKGVLIYDIESDPDNQHDFLHGFVSAKIRNNQSWDLEETKYHAILNLYKDKEHLTWGKINQKINYFYNWPILHYGETESLAIYQMAKRQGANISELKNLKTRLIDIHACLKNSWLLPISNYSLKTVAKWLGFKWRLEGADGAKALLWWRQWESSNYNRKSSSNLCKKILDYNQDDCLATWEIAKWLLTNSN